jgi:hypothetical protein
LIRRLLSFIQIGRNLYGTLSKPQFFSPIWRLNASFAFPPVVKGSSLFNMLKKRLL